MTTVSQPRATRARRSSRPSGDDRELAILETAERLLEERPLAEISVDDLAKGAGISRPTFYFYFASKDAVLLTLLERVIGEADAALAKLIENPSAEESFWRNGINVFFETFGAHRAVCAAAVAAKTTGTAAQDLWATSMQRWIDHSTGVIEAERARGAAPVTVPAHELSTALNLMNESVMTSSFAGQQPSLPDDRVLDNLVHIWVTSIYGVSR